MNKRKAVNTNINPCKMCMPMGGSLALKGIAQSMTLMHGSQGCATYIRRHMATHFNEPVDIASTSMSENQTVYGGAKNLRQGIKNVIKLYDPKVIGVLTTCLAETIGEDIKNVIEEFTATHDLGDVDIVPVHTPGYGGTHYEGYFATLKGILEYFTKDVDAKEKTDSINIILGDVSAADIREIKRIAGLFEVPITIYPDYSDTLDGAYNQNYKKLPSGGTTREEIRAMAKAKATIEMAPLLAERFSPGAYLEESYGVEFNRCPIPVGMKNTDEFVGLLSKISGKPVPESLKAERGRMLDGLVDSHKYNGEGRAVIYGNPELVYSLTTMCLESGIQPVLAATGANAPLLEAKLDHPELTVLNKVDFLEIQQYMEGKNPNILIGNSDGKYLEEKEGLPLIRVGFPVHDHVGEQRKLHVGYTGSMQFLDEITNTLLDVKHRNYRKNQYDKFYDQPISFGGEAHAKL